MKCQVRSFIKATPLIALSIGCGSEASDQDDVTERHTHLDPQWTLIIGQHEQRFSVDEVPLEATSTPLTDDDYLAWDTERARQGAYHPDIQAPSETAQTIELAATFPPGDMMEVMITLHDPGFEFDRFQAIRQLITVEEQDAASDALVVERQQQLADSGQAEILDRLTALGATVNSVFWIDNSISVNVPAELVSVVASWPEVTSLSYEDPSRREEPDNDGVDVRTETFSGNLLSAGHDGTDGGSGTTSSAPVPIRLAVIESGIGNGLIRRTLPAFKNALLGARIQVVYQCNTSACTSTASNGPFASNHGTTMTWQAAGSIVSWNAGIPRDPNYPGVDTTAQRRRSGVAPGVNIYYLQYDGSFTSRKLAVQKAAGHLADVINISAGGNAASQCDTIATPRTYDPSSANIAFTQAMATGSIVVKSAGNEHTAGESCSVAFPAWRPDVLTVGALETPGATTTDAAFMQATSGRGTVQIGYENGSFLETSHVPVALSAPGAIERYPISDIAYDGDSGSSVSVRGTSPATAIVSGNAALLKHAFFDLGYPITPAALFTNMLLMGEGWWASWSGNLDDNWGLELSGPTYYASPTSGFGKLRMHFPSTSDPTMGASGTWKWTVPPPQTLIQGAGYFWKANPNSSGQNTPFPSNTTQFKWAFAYFPSDMNDYGSMGMEVREAPAGATCSTFVPTTSTTTLRAREWTSSNKKVIHMAGSNVASKCLFLFVGAYYTPGSSIPVNTAYYYHTGNTLPH